MQTKFEPIEVSNSQKRLNGEKNEVKNKPAC
jgi:hypothetical protein